MSAGKISARHRAGFTLLELIVVLVIIGIVSGFVVPRLAGGLSGMNLKRASVNLSAILRHAASCSVSEYQTYCVAMDLDDSRVLSFPVDLSRIHESMDTLLDNNGEGDGEHDLMEEYLLPEGVRIVQAFSGLDADNPVTSGWFRILFFPNGSTRGGELHLMDSREVEAFIHVAFLTGTVEVEI